MQAEHSDSDRLFRAFARSGDPRALGEVYDRLAPELLRVALHTTRAAAEAEDVLQATFVAAIERARSFDPAQRVMPWLVGILANEAKKARERAARRPDPERLEHGSKPDLERDPALAAERSELLHALDAALARMPEVFRPVLVLRLRHELTVTEIAAALGRPSGTVRSQLARGTELLRRSLPVGLAGALLACSTPTRGLAAVRCAIVEHAAALHAPWIASTVIGGLFAVKKLVALAAVLLVLFSVWVATRPSPASAGVEQTVATPPAVTDKALEVAQDRTPEPRAAPQREALPSTPAAALAPAKPASPAGAELVVHVRWPDDTDAEGEVVLVLPMSSAHSDDALSTPTDRTGSARFHDLAAGPVQVRLLRGGETNVVLEASQEKTIELAIRAGVTVTGRVVDGRGEPVPAAGIWLSERYYTNLGHIVATSDAHGAFVVRAVGPDHYLGARKRGFAATGLRSVRGAPGDESAIELRLEQSAALVHGRIAALDGTPIAGAQVLLGDEWPAFSVRLDDGSYGAAGAPERTLTDEHGLFELGCAPLGTQTLQVRAAGFAPYHGTLDVLAEDPNECAVELLREARVVGRVRTPNGAPIPSVWIRCGDTNMFDSASVWSGLDGRFELDGLGGAHQLVLAREPKLGEARIELSLRPGETYDWNVELKPASGIHGRVVDARGQPLAGHVVVALPGDGTAERMRSEQSDAEGRFSIGPLDNEAYTLWVQKPLGWRDFPLLEQKDVWPSSAPLELRLSDEAERGRIVGEVVTPDGAPLAGAELQLWHVERNLWRSFASAGERGALDVEDVPTGTVELELRHPDHPWKSLGEHRIEAGATLDLGRITLAEAGRLRVQLAGLPAEQYASLRAMLSDASNHESGVVHIAGDALTSGPLAPGTHTLVLGGDGVRQERRALAITAGVETTFELRLERCGLRTVAFALPAGDEPPRWIACSLFDANDVLVWNGSADCEHTPPTARVSAPPGNYTLVVSGAGPLAGRFELALTSLRTDEVALLLPLARTP